MVERRLSALADDVRGQVRTPSFDTLAGRATRRRRRVRTTAVVAVVTVLALVAGVDQVVDSSRAGQDVVERPDRGPGRLTPEQVVHDPAAGLSGFAVSASDPDVRAALWQVCVDKWCNRWRQSLAVTDDGFETTSYVDLPLDAWVLTPLYDDTFAIATSSDVMLIDSDGTARRVEPTDRPRPMRSGEVFVPASEPTIGLAVDPRSEAAHPIPLPAFDQIATVDQTPDGRLLGKATRGTDVYAVWSADGGRSWSDRLLKTDAGVAGLATGTRSAWAPIQSFAPGLMAYLGGRNPVIHRSTDGGATWQILPPLGLGDSGPASGWLVVRPDGSLWVAPIPTKNLDAGPYETVGTDWSQLDPVAPGFPDDLQVRYAELEHAGLATDGTLMLYVSGRDEQLFVSTDGGNTWELTAAR